MTICGGTGYLALPQTLCYTDRTIILFGRLEHETSAS